MLSNDLFFYISELKHFLHDSFFLSFSLQWKEKEERWTMQELKHEKRTGLVFKLK